MAIFNCSKREDAGWVGHRNVLAALVLSCLPSPSRPFLLGSPECDPVLIFPVTELYSYTENLEFTTNRRCFEEDFKTQGDLSPLLMETCFFLSEDPGGI